MTRLRDLWVVALLATAVLLVAGCSLITVKLPNPCPTPSPEEKR